MKTAAIIAATALCTLIITSVLMILVPGAARSQQQAEEGPSDGATPEPLICYSIEDPFITNMKDSKRYVKASIVLGLSREEDVETLKNYDYIVKDAIIRILRDITESEYANSRSQQILGDRICEELNGELQVAGIKKVYFKEFVIS
ncbi:MAG: flagellar basal body-associated FliL family protein [Christensenellales bacterium]